MFKDIFKNIYLLFAMLSLSACSLAPSYLTPEMPVPQVWPSGVAYEHSLEFTGFELESFVQDEKLSTLIQMAINSNRDLRKQIADIEAARASYRITRSNILPSIGTASSAAHSQGASSPLVNNYSVELGLNAFELDLFGKNKNLRDSALENYLATKSATESAKISLIAETMNAWVTLAADSELLNIANNTIKSAGATTDLALSRYEAGVTSKLDVLQAETVYYQAKADVANFTAQVANDLNALELLVGQSVDKELLPDSFANNSSWLGSVQAGLSSEILLRRPDIIAAEHLLKAANADIGAARATFFPSISLTSSAGYASTNLTDLFTGSALWSFSGGVNLPIFTWGKNKANLDYSEAKYQSTLASYDYTIQTAFKEVSDALARKGTINKQLEAQLALLNTAEEGYVLAGKRYDLGVDSYLSVLEAQRTLYSSEQAMINTQLAELRNRITLYKSVGGGNERYIEYRAK